MDYHDPRAHIFHALLSVCFTKVVEMSISRTASAAVEEYQSASLSYCLDLESAATPH
jgi:hypothetical protein